MLDLLPYDVGRVEVLRGPQGTLYGAGAMGGLLKYVTRDPDVGANLPLVADRLELRASYARNELPGYIDNTVTGRKDINDGTQESARVALLWQASDAFSLQLTAMRQSIDSDNNAIAALTDAAAALARSAERPIRGRAVRKGHRFLLGNAEVGSGLGRPRRGERLLGRHHGPARQHRQDRHVRSRSSAEAGQPY